MARPVLVTTKYRGVFFGYTEGGLQDRVTLKKGRCCLYWPDGTRGFVGLAVSGPIEGSRVGPAADMELSGVVCMIECTPEAVERWEAAPWSDD